MPEFRYNTRTSPGPPMYSCQDCRFYVFNNEAAIVAHCRRYGHGGENTAPPPSIDEYIYKEAPLPPRDVIITLGFLCWNTRKVSVEGAVALSQEVERLERLGCIPRIMIVDNGSTDGTADAIEEALLKLPFSDTTIICNETNEGSSRGRNAIIDAALANGSKYLLFLDGDIGIVPLSSYLMIRYLECHEKVGCIGAYSASYTNIPGRETQCIQEFPESCVKNHINCAWTQYGLFRCQMFRDGIRFDVSGPFGEPGWGYEDDDLCFQMLSAGWENRYFWGMKYLHRNIRSSWPNLKADGLDPLAIFNKRKDYLLEKWGNKPLNPAILHSVRRQIPPAEEKQLCLA